MIQIHIANSAMGTHQQKWPQGPLTNQNDLRLLETWLYGHRGCVHGYENIDPEFAAPAELVPAPLTVEVHMTRTIVDSEDSQRMAVAKPTRAALLEAQKEVIIMV